MDLDGQNNFNDFKAFRGCLQDQKLSGFASGKDHRWLGGLSPNPLSSSSARKPTTRNSAHPQAASENNVLTYQKAKVENTIKTKLRT